MAGEGPGAVGEDEGLLVLAAHAPVVGVLDALGTFGRVHRGDGDELILGIPGVVLHAVGEHIPVTVVHRGILNRRAGRGLGDRDILVGGIGGVGDGLALLGVGATVAHRVVGVGLVERGHHGSGGIRLLGRDELFQAVVAVLPLLTGFFQGFDALIVRRERVAHAHLLAIGGGVGDLGQASPGVVGAVGTQDVALGR